MMKHVCVRFVLMAVLEQTFAAVLLGGGHTTNAHELEENAVPSAGHRKSEHHDHRSDFPHAGIITSDRELEEFKKLSPDEAKAKLRTILVEMDGNRDGLVDKRELSRRILETFRHLSAEEADSEFADSDADGDGWLTWKEYLMDTYGSGEEDIPAAAAEGDDDDDDDDDDVAAQEKALFSAADRDNDGRLTREEFRTFYTPEDYEHTIPLVLNDVMHRVDSDDDKTIGFDEYIKHRGNDDPKLFNDPEWTRVEKIKFEHEYDADGDGVLRGEEILSWLMPNNDMMSKSEAEDLIGQADKNGDGALSYDEIMDNYLLFVSQGDYPYDDFKDEL